MRSRANTGDCRRQRQKLNHSKSDDNRRRSFDRHRRDSQQASRHSLNTPVVVEGCGPEYELKYFTSLSLEKEERRSSITDDSHVMEMGDNQVHVVNVSVEERIEDDALLEEPELEIGNDCEGIVSDMGDVMDKCENNEDEVEQNVENSTEILLKVEE